MVVNHKHKYLFIEVPSTGSTAISAELTAYYGGERVLRKHANYTEFRRLFRRQVNEYFVFATVRNPLDMAVTEYMKLKGNHKEQYTTPEFFERNGGFVPDRQLEEFEYIRAHDAEFSDFFRRFRTSIYHNWFLVCHSQFDYVMKRENLGDEFEKVLGMIGLEPVRQLPEVNKTALKDRHFEDYYSTEIHRQARRCYGPFMRQWGYEFPASWESNSITATDMMKYQLKEKLVNIIARWVTLSPFSPTVQRVKAVVDSMF